MSFTKIIDSDYELAFEIIYNYAGWAEKIPKIYLRT